MDKVIEQLCKLFTDDEITVVQEGEHVQLLGDRMILQVKPTVEVSFHAAMRPDKSAQLALDINRITNQDVTISQSFWPNPKGGYIVGKEAGKQLVKYILGQVKMNQLYEYLVNNGNDRIEH